MTRPFTEQERELLDHLVTGAPDEKSLRPQLDTSEYGEPWFTGSQSFTIVGANTPGNDVVRGIMRTAAVHANSSPAAGPATGELILWGVDGVITDLEYAWVTDAMPTSLPSREQVAAAGD